MQKHDSSTRLSLLLALALFLTLLAAWPQPAQAQTGKRIALVVGNAAYADRPLRNPVNDANLMSTTLRDLGFEVVVLRNADRRALLAGLRDFEAKARDAEVALFFYAGHGAQVGGSNYLLPLNAQINAESDVPDEAVDAASVLRRMEDARAKVGLVILDACRDNPYQGATRSATRGLARMNVPTGSIVAYATAPGSVAADGTGNNGVYTEQLVRHLRQPGLDLRDVFDRTASEVERITGGKQRPREEVGLRGRFVLQPGGTQQASVAVEPSPRAQPVGPSAADIEQQAWDAARSANTMAGYQAYLAEYPQGRFAAAARVASTALRPAPAPTPVPAPTPAPQPMATVLADPNFPARPVTLIVPFAPGGPTDRVARDLAQALSTKLGGAMVVVDNVAGAGGAIGAQKALRATADGYTLLLHNVGVVTGPALYRSAPFRPLEDFEPLGLVSEVPLALVGKPGLLVGNLPELTRLIRSGAKLNMANAGLGSTSHLCGLLLQQTMRVDFTLVPYRGTAPALTDLIAGQTDIMCDTVTNLDGQITAGKVKPLALMSAGASKDWSRAMPSLSQQGLGAAELSNWHGLFAPRGTPAGVLAKINNALRSATQDPDFRRKQESIGAVVVTDDRQSADGHRRYLQAEVNRWTSVIRAGGVYID
jgi:tripartite-type tricarboxylate transporter receptor subunit TctC/uncharacterized caspase-like protein